MPRSGHLLDVGHQGAVVALPRAALAQSPPMRFSPSTPAAEGR